MFCITGVLATFVRIHRTSSATKMPGILLEEKIFYMFRSGTNKHWQTKIIEISKVKLITSRTKLVHCKTVSISRESDVIYLIIFNVYLIFNKQLFDI